MIEHCLHNADFCIGPWLLRDFSDHNDFISLEDGSNFFLV